MMTIKQLRSGGEMAQAAQSSVSATGHMDDEISLGYAIVAARKFFARSTARGENF